MLEHLPLSRAKRSPAAIVQAALFLGLIRRRPRIAHHIEVLVDPEQLLVLRPAETAMSSVATS